MLSPSIAEASPIAWSSQEAPVRAKAGLRLPQFTPALPCLNSAQVSGATERIRLEPYGSTKLRLAIFPDVQS